MEVKLAKPQHPPTSLNGRLLQGGRNHRFIRTCELYIFTIRKFDFIQMQFYCTSSYAPTANEKGMSSKL